MSPQPHYARLGAAFARRFFLHRGDPLQVVATEAELADFFAMVTEMLGGLIVAQNPILRLRSGVEAQAADRLTVMVNGLPTIPVGSVASHG